MFRRGRFDDLVRRQLDLLAVDEAALLAEAEAADAAWSNASRDDAEELYGDFQRVVDAFGEQLYDVRETYAGTLDDRTADGYRAAFDKAARSRFGRYAAVLDES